MTEAAVLQADLQAECDADRRRIVTLTAQLELPSPRQFLDASRAGRAQDAAAGRHVVELERLGTRAAHFAQDMRGILATCQEEEAPGGSMFTTPASERDAQWRAVQMTIAAAFPELPRLRELRRDEPRRRPASAGLHEEVIL